VRALIDAEAEIVHMILNAIENDIYSSVDACPNAKKMWIEIERLRQGVFINIHDVKTKLFWEFARNANPLTLVATTQHYPDYHPQAPKTYQTQAPLSRQTSCTRSHATTKCKGKEIVKAPLPPPEPDTKEDCWKLKSVCHWANPIKDLKWSNVPGVKLSPLSESDETFPSLQALWDLYYLFGGFMDYLWSCELDISNFRSALSTIKCLEWCCLNIGMVI
ncbi:hypothetical protein Tco_0383321, partial [Tanacetum coccineum]